MTIRWPRGYQLAVALARTSLWVVVPIIIAVSSQFSTQLRAFCLAGAIAAIATAWWLASRTELAVSNDAIRITRYHRTWAFAPAEIERIGVGIDKAATTARSPSKRVIAVGVRSGTGEVVLAAVTTFQTESGREALAARLHEFGHRHGIAVDLPTDLSLGWGTHGRGRRISTVDHRAILRHEFPLITDASRGQFRPPEH